MSKTEKNTVVTVSDLEVTLSSFLTKSSKIRYLHSLGKKNSEICKLVKYEDGRNLRPQHVRNVLITPLKKV